jgi:hypothetical protein
MTGHPRLAERATSVFRQSTATCLGSMGPRSHIARHGYQVTLGSPRFRVVQPPEMWWRPRTGRSRELRENHKEANVRKRAKKAVARRAVKKAVVRRAVKKRAVKRAVVRRAVKKRAVKRALVKRAVKRRALKRALVRRAVGRAIITRALAHRMGEGSAQ